MCVPEQRFSASTEKVSALSVAFAVPAAVRLPRSAAARRALLTMLLLGGFLTLAFLFGGSAQAASAAPAGTDRDAVGSASSGLPIPEKSSGSLPVGGEEAGNELGLSEAELAERRREAREAAARTASRVLEPVAQGAEDTGRVTRPVEDTVEGVTGAVGLDGLSDGLGLRPGEEGEDAPGDGDGDDVPGGGGHSTPSGESGDSARDLDGQRSYAGPDSARVPFPEGPVQRGTSGDGTSRGDDGGVPDRLPSQQAPAAPASVTSQYAGDGKGPRGQHQLAGVVSGAGNSGPLQSGAVRAAAGTPTRERAAEILEFPG